MHNIRMYIVPHSLSLLFLISSLFRSAVGTCSKTGPCSCQTEDGGKLDLSPISKNDGTPQFVDIPDQRGFDHFSWNPCTPFTEGTAFDVMVVQVRNGVPQRFYYNLGTLDSASFSESSKGVILQYSADAVMENTLRTSYFTLICDESLEGQLTALGERGTQAIYDFELRSKYACIKGVPGGGTQISVSISIGTVLVIVFLSLVFIYLVGGILFQTFVRKATGKDRVPNYEMWRQFPIYVKTGIVFLIRGGKNVPAYQAI
ncbi:hypothetical protein ACJMK2_023554 [Sinanodonta woodiana]|uniref:Cation-dependent mannose-6-phosphate receptor n=1 Tax=Sinanodonta woodiana TaxID=1069815 RepID=A0ABD3T4N0_SINWO